MTIEKITIKDFINGPVHYDKWGAGYIWITEPDGGQQMLCDVRGFGRIQNLVNEKFGKFDEETAVKFQDEIGEFIAAAINEKLEREKK